MTKSTFKLFSLLLIIMFSLNSILAQEKEVNTKQAIHTYKEHTVNLFPNPVIDKELNIETSGEVSKVEIMNIIGRSVFKIKNPRNEKDFRIPLSACEKGVYLSKIVFNDKKTVIKKFLIK